MSIINRLEHKVVVSVQAMPSEPLYLEKCMVAMMKSVIKGGAGALRVAGARDVKNAKHLSDIIPKNWQEIVYITPTLKEVISLVDAGADVIAFDGTMRQREGGCTLAEIIKYIRINKRTSMADISTVEEGINAAKLGADILSTTLSGYTLESKGVSQTEPDFKLLEELVKETDKPVVLEGRIWEPWQVDKAFELGAHCVVIGSAITRPQLITKRFVQRNS